MPPTVTLYSAPWCGYCRIAKRFLDEQQVPYTEINIERTRKPHSVWSSGTMVVVPSPRLISTALF